MDRTLYPAYVDNWDNERFRERVLEHLRPHDTVLDYGAGRGALEAMRLRGHVRRLAGVDPDAAVLENPYLDEAKLLALPEGTIPYPDETFDVVISNNVLEHPSDPKTTFREIRRVLKAGGRFLAKTPNRRHYVPLAARLTPHAFHLFYNRLRGREERDTFPTCYRCNTIRRVRSLARETGFEVSWLETWEGRPEYLRLVPPLYLLGFLYERLANASDLLAWLRCVLVVELRKPAAPV